VAKIRYFAVISCSAVTRPSSRSCACSRAIIPPNVCSHSYFVASCQLLCFAALWWLRFFQSSICYAGMAFAVISGGHYTIDVLIAYWLASHVFWAYHQIFELPLGRRRHQPLTNLWWYYACYWLEANVPDGRLANSLSWPLWMPECARRRWPLLCRRWCADSPVQASNGAAPLLVHVHGGAPSTTPSDGNDITNRYGVTGRFMKGPFCKRELRQWSGIHPPTCVYFTVFSNCSNAISLQRWFSSTDGDSDARPLPTIVQSPPA
jgi:hypothetical protein